MADASHPRVLIVDDSPALRRQVCDMLANEEFEVIDALESGERLEATVDAMDPDIIVLDVSMPGENGLALAARLVKRGCAAKIVFLSVHEDLDYMRAAFVAGGSGYVVKVRLLSDLAPALRTVLAGSGFISPFQRTRPTE